MQLDVAAARFVVPGENAGLAVTYAGNADTEGIGNWGFAQVADLDVDGAS